VDEDTIKYLKGLKIYEAAQTIVIQDGFAKEFIEMPKKGSVDPPFLKLNAFRQEARNLWDAWYTDKVCFHYIDHFAGLLMAIKGAHADQGCEACKIWVGQHYVLPGEDFDGGLHCGQECTAEYDCASVICDEVSWWLDNHWPRFLKNWIWDNAELPDELLIELASPSLEEVTANRLAPKVSVNIKPDGQVSFI